MTDISTRKVILLSIDGLGLSTSWKGNAFQTSNPENFNKLWNDYQHHALFPTSKLLPASLYYSQPDLNYVLMTTGDSPTSKMEIAKASIDDKTFFSSPALSELFDNVLRHSSVLHLVCCFSPKQQFFDLDILLGLIRSAKANGVSNIFVHLFINNDWSDKETLSKQLLVTEEKIQSLGIDGIVTLGGIDSNRFLAAPKFFNKLFNSSWGVIDKFTKKDFSSLPFHTKAGVPKNLLNNFDSIIFTSPEIPQELYDLIFSLSSRSSSRLQYVSLFSLFSLPKNQGFKITPILMRKNSHSIFSLLEQKGVKSRVLAEESQMLSLMNNALLDMTFADEMYIGDNSFASPEALCERFLSTLLLEIVDKKYAFYFARLSAISKIDNFEKATSVLQQLDKFWPKLEKSIIENDAIAIITSGYGGVEQIDKSGPSDNLLPLVIVSSKKSAKSEDSLIGSLRQNLDHRMTYKVLRESLEV